MTRLESIYELDPIPLILLKKGEEGVVYSFGNLSCDEMARLQVLGLGLGEAFTVLYTYPCYLLALGRERVALDLERALSLEVLSLDKQESRDPGRRIG